MFPFCPALSRGIQALLYQWRTNNFEHGRAAGTPFALIENGTRPQQRVITGTLAELPKLQRQHGVRSPALLFAVLAGLIAWYYFFVLAALSADSGARVSVAIQLTSQVLPPSSENDCTKRAESGLMSQITKRTRIARPLSVS